MKKLLVVLILIGVALVGVAYWTKVRLRVPSDEGYTFAKVEYGDFAERISATGLVQPREVAAVTSETPGIVVEILPEADFDRHVEEGQILVKLDDKMAKLRLKQAQGMVDEAKAALSQAEAVKKGADSQLKYWKGITEAQGERAGSRKDLEKAEYDVEAAKAAVERAKATIEQAKRAKDLAQLLLDLTKVKAPISGTIIDKKVVRGQPVGPVPSPSSPSSTSGGLQSLLSSHPARDSVAGMASGPLFLIAKDLSRMQIHAQVAEGDISKLRVGLSAIFTVYAYSEEDEKFHGKVAQVRQMPTNVQGAVFYTVIIDVDPEQKDAKEWRLRPGMTAMADIIRRTHEDVWKMPTAALNFSLDEHYQTPAAKAKLEKWQNQPDWKPVWVMKDKKPWPIFVRTGGRNSNRETGIKDGQYSEVLEWEPELEFKPDPKNPMQVIISAPPVSKPGLLDRQTGLRI